MDKYCDNVLDCPDGEDEEPCGGNSSVECGIDEFRCADEICIAKEKQCDGVQDCTEGDDEHLCSKKNGEKRFSRLAY